jgi:N-acyl-D-amino-acid deacylase
MYRRQWTKGCIASYASTIGVQLLANQEAFQPIDFMFRTFVSSNEVPGGALAIAKSGQLKYAAYLGFADKKSSLPIGHRSLFRIASLSKPITAVAILKSIESGRLSLDDKIHSLLALGKPSDLRWREITIRHLLQHTGGWDREGTLDPMFANRQVSEFTGRTLPISHQDLIRYMLARPLDFEPGSRYAYSNFGYCLLGRILERISEESYEEHVRKQVLGPIDCMESRIGKSVLNELADNEVHYYDGEEKRPGVLGSAESVVRVYGSWDQQLLDAHGGWISTAIEMTRFASCLPIRNCRPSVLLAPESIHTMDQPLPKEIDLGEDEVSKDVRYGMGWSIRTLRNGSINAWHTGDLPGTSTIMVRRHDDFAWTALFNARTNPAGKRLAQLIDPLIHRAVDEVRLWPKHDLFESLLSRSPSPKDGK